MNFCQRERKKGHTTRGMEIGELYDYSDTDIVDDGEVIAEIWSIKASRFDSDFDSSGKYREEAGYLDIPGRDDECIKIVKDYLSISQVRELYRIIRSKFPPKITIDHNFEITDVSEIVDEVDRQELEGIKSRLEAAKAQTTLRKAIQDLIKEFANLHPLLYTCGDSLDKEVS